MKPILTGLLGAALIAAMISQPLFAHHGRGRSYDLSKEVSVTGTVTELGWRNPHVALYVNAENETGDEVVWGFEAHNVSTMSRIGWYRNSVRPGQKVTVTFNPSWSGAPVGVLRRIEFPDGTEIDTSVAGPSPSADSEN